MESNGRPTEQRQSRRPWMTFKCLNVSRKQNILSAISRTIVQQLIIATTDGMTIPRRV